MAGAFWCIVEDDRQGNPKKVMAEVLGEASRLAAQAGGQVEAVWLTDKASPRAQAARGVGRQARVAGGERGVCAVSRRGVDADPGRAGRQGIPQGDLRRR